MRREARQQYIRLFLLPLRVARSGRFGRDAKSQTLENKSAHQQPGNHPRKKQEIKHARTQAKPQVTSAEMVSIVSIAVRLITQSLLTSFVIFMRSIHTMVTTVAIMIDTSISIIFCMPMITRDEQRRCADDMRRIRQRVKMPAGGEYNAANKPAGLECTGVRFRYEFSPLDSGGRRT